MKALADAVGMVANGILKTLREEGGDFGVDGWTFHHYLRQAGIEHRPG